MAASPPAPGSPCSTSSRVHGIASSVRPSAGGCPSPRLRCTTRWATPPGARRGSQVASRSCSTALPTRIGGFDQTRSNRTSSGMPSAVVACTPSSPSAAALRRVRSSARSLTSRAQTVAAGERSARVRAMGPQPQPRSRKVPVVGGAGASSSSTAVPLSRPPGEKMPGATSTSASCPASRTRHPAALVGARGGGREVVVVSRSSQATLAAGGRKGSLRGVDAMRP